MNHSSAIVAYQPLLQSIAYRMVGCIQDAEDIVQETFYKYLTIDHSKILNTKAYLITSVRNSCINHLNNLNQKKKEYLDSIHIQDIMDKMDFSHLDLKHEMNHALSIINKKLAPVERAIFLLREAFDFDYDELQAIFNKKKDHCRQLVCRAKEKLASESSKVAEDKTDDRAGIADAFNKASIDGHVQDLVSYLKGLKK